MVMMRPDEVSILTSQMGGYDEDEIPDADQMHGLGVADLEKPMGLLLGAKPDVVFYGCTSASLAHGPAFDRDLATQIAAKSGAKTVTAAGALVNALRFLGGSQIGFASPYVPAINDMAVRFLVEMGVATIKRSEVTGVLDNTSQGALGPDAVFALGLAADDPGAEAIILSCTDMRSAETLARLEAEIGKPVICSNQAMLFEAMHVLGFKEPIRGFGTLLEQARQ